VALKSKKKIFIFDIDNTICYTKKNFYQKAKPKKKIINLINNLKKKGHVINFYTSRYMGRTNQNVKLVKKKYKFRTEKQLKKWGVNYDKLVMGKPSYDLFVDDRSINPKHVNIFQSLIKFTK
tara:strand:- start:110 stop:475 length:366 start_codon:yes stop_codon:yes gene_type:complete